MMQRGDLLTLPPPGETAMKHIGLTAFASAAVLFVFCSAAFGQDIKPTPIENNARISKEVTVRQAYALAAMVRLHGYRCDSISGVALFVLSRGYHLFCNRSNYHFELADKGGKWVVTVD